MLNQALWKEHGDVRSRSRNTRDPKPHYPDQMLSKNASTLKLDLPCAEF